MAERPVFAVSLDNRFYTRENTEFETEPKTYFYNWLYANALNLHDSLAGQIVLKKLSIIPLKKTKFN